MVNIIQIPINHLLEVSGLDPANIRILTCSLLSYPFSAIFKRLPDQNYTLKNGYIVTISSFYIFGILELYLGLVSLLLAALGSYFITRYVTAKSMPWINFVFLMLYLSYHHVREQFFQVYDPTTIDITGALMVMVMKLSAFGWSVYDAKQPSDQLTSYTRSRIIPKHPNLLPYLGYCFFFASLLTGPAFDYADYDRFVHNTLFEDVPESRRPGKAKRRIPRSGKVATKRLLQGFSWAALFVILPNYVSPDHMFSKEYVSHGFIYRIFYMWIVGFFLRLKYYCIWTIAEGACILCGIGYNGYDSLRDKFKWDRVRNINPLVFETGQNVHVCLEAWNMNTNKWLKNFVYLRLARKGKKPGFKSTVATFATSAFWHGTRPGYYLTFLVGALLQTVGKIFRRNFRPIFIDKDGNKAKSKPVYDFVGYVINQLAFGFVVQPFNILDFKKSIYVWTTVYFWVPVGIFTVFFAFRGPYGKKVSKFIAQYHMSQDTTVRPKGFNRVESERVVKALSSYISKDRDLVYAPTLGLPSLDDLEKLDKEEISEELEELSQAWNSFKDDDGKDLKQAYGNFVNEINEIFNVHKEKMKESVEGVKEKRE